MIGLIFRLAERLASLERRFLTLGMALLTIVVVVQVAARNMGLYIPWAEDVALLIFTWCVFLGASLALRTGSHYVIDMWGSRRVWLRQGLTVLVTVGVALFIAILVWQGALMTWLVSGRTSGAGEISMGWFFLSLPTASLFSLVHLLEAAARDLRQPKGGPS